MTTSPWRRFVTLSTDLGEIAKLIALVLGILGLIGLYVPGFRTWVETKFAPRAWYYIGAVSNGRFSAEKYQHPIWSGGVAPAAKLDSLPGQIVITMDHKLHIGRRAPSGSAPVDSVSDGGVCLYVSDVHKITQANDPKIYIWVQAVRVTC